MTLRCILKNFTSAVNTLSADVLTLEISCGNDKIEAIIDTLSVYGIIEMTRTGIVALQRGAEGINQLFLFLSPPQRHISVTQLILMFINLIILNYSDTYYPLNTLPA